VAGSLADWLERQEKTHPSAIDLTLERVRAVARRLELLQPAYRVVTVAGTNGKGSTVAYLDAVLRAHGVRTGRFTSPHLTRYNERICVDGIEATDDSLIASFERIDAARGDITLTFFEYNALAALDLFRVAGVDAAVLEVGLGGRLDATNIIDADVGVLCSIGLDHVDWLGSTLEEIGREKAGIFRAGRPAVLGNANLPRSVYQEIERIGAHALTFGRDFQVSVLPDPAAPRWNFTCGPVELRELPLPRTPGPHQVRNAATALAALVVGGFGIALEPDATGRALRSVHLSGRFQVVPGDVEWILDVAHNVPAAQVLAKNLRALPRRRTIAVCGILADKDVAGIAATLSADIDTWIPVALEGPRALAPAELVLRLPAGAAIDAHAGDVASACRRARELARPGDRVLVFGSFLTVGPALEYLGI
jgi:dihydrofolate synthase / folylpolyglutamate synthase